MAERLSLAERARIEALSGAGSRIDEIAELIGRDRSTVYRELDRGRGRDGVYRAGPAHAAAGRRARRPRTAKLEADLALAGQVKARLALCWSPHAISADLAAVGVSVCAETIYRAAYSSRCLGDDLSCSLGQERALAANHVPQGATLDELHHHVVRGAFVAPIEDRNDVRLRQVGSCLGLAPESLDEGLIVGELRMEHLDGNLPAEEQILTPIDIGHAAAGQMAQQPVAVGENAIFNHGA